MKKISIPSSDDFFFRSDYKIKELEKINKFIFRNPETFKEDLNMINSLPDLNVILICGIPGVGKTFMTKNIEKLINESFNNEIFELSKFFQLKIYLLMRYLAYLLLILKPINNKISI